MVSFSTKIKSFFKSLSRPLHLWRKHRRSKRRQKLLGPHVRALLVPCQQGLFLVDPQDLGVGRDLCWHGTYGQQELARIQALIHPNSRVLVVGAHIGSLAIPLASHVKQITAVEANPYTFELLQMNKSLNAAKNLDLIPLAASDRRQMVQFLLSTHNSGGSKCMPSVKSYRYFYDHPQVVAVQADRLDDVLKGRQFDVIVIDIEGSEYAALTGMPLLLQQAQYLIVEFIPHHLRDVAKVSVQDFLSVITPYFSSLYIPSLDQRISQDDFEQRLTDMYANEQSDGGLIFAKSKSMHDGSSP